jgi:hypothetical protein
VAVQLTDARETLDRYRAQAVLDEQTRMVYEDNRRGRY